MNRALIVEDDPGSLHALSALVELEGMEVRTARTLADARRVLEHISPDLVLTDLRLPDGDGTELLSDLHETTDVEVIVVTGNATLESAVEALRLGAYDYLTKPIDEKRLRSLLAGVKRTGELKKEISTLRDELKEMGRFGSMVGTSEPMKATYDLLGKGAPTQATIFLVGESGTGKELAAETVHQLSRRKNQPFLAVNCGAVSPTLIESELFGHERGAFTGANRQHRGFFEQADGGTLFLDEITEMPLELQVKLLRVLETGKVTRVGGSQQIDVDVRIIAATNRDPQKVVEEGKLREDLLYRLKVFPIYLPPLRERGDDIVLLAEHFLKEMGKQEDGEKGLSREAAEVLRNHPWPGNVRELKNVMHRAFILADEAVTPAELPTEVTKSAPHVAAGTSAEGALDVRVGMSIAEAERELINATLDHLDGDKKEAADVLGISLKTLYNRLRTYKGI